MGAVEDKEGIDADNDGADDEPDGYLFGDVHNILNNIIYRQA